MANPYDIIITGKDLDENIDTYINVITPIFPKFIISKEYGTKKEGLHYHMVIYSDVKKDTIKTRLKAVLPSNVKLRTTKEPEVKDIKQLIAYTLKDGDYRIIGEHDEELIEEAKKISVPKDKLKPKTMKAYKQEIEDLYLESKITLFEANEMFTKYNLDDVPDNIQQQQRDYYFQRIILKKDESLRKYYNQAEYNKQLKWIEKLRDNKECSSNADSDKTYVQADKLIREWEGEIQYLKYPL